MRIDAHHHFWRYSAAEYGWIEGSMSSIRRDFLPGDLIAEIRPAAIDAVISVQARQSLAETEWLLELAAAHPFTAGVVGCPPLAHPAILALPERFSAHPRLKALRHVLQAEPDSFFDD